MSTVRLARQSPSRTDEVWEGQADAENSQVVIRQGRRGGHLRQKVVPQSCFTEFNAELELEYRATKKRESGFIDEIDSDAAPTPVAKPVESPWPTVYVAPTDGLKQRKAFAVERERDIAQQVMLAFDLDIPPEWLIRPRLLEPSNDYALPMLLYVLGVYRSGTIFLADDESREVDPIRFVSTHGLVELDPRVPPLLPLIGLISVRQAMAAELDPQDEHTTDWFF